MRNYRIVGTSRTRVSARGTLLSFILWMPAWAEPRSAAAVRRALFMMGNQVENATE